MLVLMVYVLCLMNLMLLELLKVMIELLKVEVPKENNKVLIVFTTINDVKVLFIVSLQYALIEA